MKNILDPNLELVRAQIIATLLSLYLSNRLHIGKITQNELHIWNQFSESSEIFWRFKIDWYV